MSQVKAVLPMLMVPKYMNTEVAYKLSNYEFQCKCTEPDCTWSVIHHELISGWNALRKQHGKPLRVNSGFRCQKHNSKPEIKGVPTSRHSSGMAIDIFIGDLNPVDKALIIKRAKEIFYFVKVYPVFIHCQVEPDTEMHLGTGHFEEPPKKT